MDADLSGASVAGAMGTTVAAKLRAARDEFALPIRCESCGGNGEELTGEGYWNRCTTCDGTGSLRPEGASR